MKMRFGKFKGQNFENTPKWYQEWLIKQPWFRNPNSQKAKSEYSEALARIQGWDGYTSGGQAAYDRLFELEQQQEDRMYCSCGRMKIESEPDCGCGGMY